MATTLKMRLNTKTLTGSSTGLVFNVDYADGRNKEWASATPVAQVTATVKNEIGEMFELGAAYTFTVERNDD